MNTLILYYNVEKLQYLNEFCFSPIPLILATRYYIKLLKLLISFSESLLKSIIKSWEINRTYLFPRRLKIYTNK